VSNTSAVVLAAGEGKRMKSALPKVLHPCCGRPLIDYILKSAAALTTDIVIVVGHGASMVIEQLGDQWRYALQEQQLGTGHAVLQALPLLPQEGRLLVLCGDTPLIDEQVLRPLAAADDDQSAATVATTFVPDPQGYGRIIRNSQGLIDRIVEERDATEAQKKICEINSGTYSFDLKQLRHYLPLLTAKNAQQEYYLTDLVAMMHADGLKVKALVIDDYHKGLGINDRIQLAEASALIREAINKKLMQDGVTIEDPLSTWIDSGVEIGPDTVIRPNCIIESGTVIGAACSIGPGVHLKRAVVGKRVSISYSVVEDSVVKDDTKLKPFTMISPFR
jgi:bifunctional UDP-N-acetylglucosamine pyrophosphorylase / glucosamine-1-phosphate N-acetyltransferase